MVIAVERGPESLLHPLMRLPVLLHNSSGKPLQSRGCRSRELGGSSTGGLSHVSTAPETLRPPSPN